MVACIDLTTAAIDGESASEKPASVVCADADEAIQRTHSNRLSDRIIVQLPLRAYTGGSQSGAS
jgi:hypothetical protein